MSEAPVRPFKFVCAPRPAPARSYCRAQVRRRLASAAFAAVLLAGLLPGPAGAAQATSPGLATHATPAQVTSPGSWDNFNRSAANPYWGTASSGFGWATDNVGGQCSGYTSTVDGQEGVMTAPATGGYCAIWGSLMQTDYPGAGGAGPWKAGSWDFTAKVKTSALDTSGVRFGVEQNWVNYPWTTLGLGFSSTQGYVSIDGTATAPFSWQANTWYWVEWTQVWGTRSAPASGQ